MSGEVKRKDARSRSESESEEGVLESDVADAKPSVEKLLDEVRVGVKGQSNLEIARTPRNAFRCSLGRFLHEVERLIGCEGFTAYQVQTNSECVQGKSPGVRARVLRSVPERRRIQTIV